MTVTNKSDQPIQVAFQGNDDDGWSPWQILDLGQGAIHSDTFTWSVEDQSVKAAVFYQDRTMQFAEAHNGGIAASDDVMFILYLHPQRNVKPWDRYQMDKGETKTVSFEGKKYTLQRGADDQYLERSKTLSLDVLGAS